MIDDSYACRRGKGRTRRSIAPSTSPAATVCFAVRHREFFPTVDHAILAGQLAPADRLATPWR